MCPANKKYRQTAVTKTSKQDALIMYQSRLRAIGNSKGVILNNDLIETSGIRFEEDIILYAAVGSITIVQAKAEDVNTDLSSWGKQFKAAFKKGFKPEDDMFTDMSNEFDKNEW